ncbi:chitinase 2-like [Lolium rigidum]|uniref:chitinase 2-like n=1 Tax=Lolium rigidum TaxID=89674 RepID=UPI001F5CA7E1|nr:chitinase 2-like [Lolium rigidum]
MTNGYLFREYIGAQFKNVRFSDVPINPNLSFNFILAFAVDYTVGARPVPTNGVFNAFWDTANLSRTDVAAIKAAHPNVSVMLGIGGDSVQDIVKAFFTPTSIDSWVANAVASLSTLITQYGLDGIDVDYEHFSVGADTFVECIGRLLTQLKAKFPNITTSIAPFERDDVQQYYQALWKKYPRVIDYVNFQFYGYGDNTNVDYYVKFYNDQQANYPGSKLLASFKTGDVTGLLSPDQGISAAKELQRQNKLPGLFIFSADSSKISPYGFKYETMAQEIIANH